MAELWLEYLMNFLALLSILTAAYYWYLMSRAELPGEGGTGETGEAAQALVNMATLGKRAASFSALGGVLIVSGSLMGIFADLP
jgi:hypothetical protein